MTATLAALRKPLLLGLGLTIFALAWVTVGLAIFQVQGSAVYVAGAIVYLLLCGMVALMLKEDRPPLLIYVAGFILCVPVLAKLFF